MPALSVAYLCIVTSWVQWLCKGDVCDTAACDRVLQRASLFLVSCTLLQYFCYNFSRTVIFQARCPVWPWGQNKKPPVLLLLIEFDLYFNSYSYSNFILTVEKMSLTCAVWSHVIPLMLVTDVIPNIMVVNTVLTLFQIMFLNYAS